MEKKIGEQLRDKIKAQKAINERKLAEETAKKLAAEQAKKAARKSRQNINRKKRVILTKEQKFEKDYLIDIETIKTNILAWLEKTKLKVAQGECEVTGFHTNLLKSGTIDDIFLSDCEKIELMKCIAKPEGSKNYPALTDLENFCESLGLKCKFKMRGNRRYHVMDSDEWHTYNFYQNSPRASSGSSYMFRGQWETTYHFTVTVSL